MSGPQLTSHSGLSVTEARRVGAFVDHLAERDDAISLDDRHRLALRDQADRLPAFTLTEADNLVAYAQLLESGGRWELAVALDPVTGDAAHLVDQLLGGAEAAVVGAGGGHLTVWHRGDDPSVAMPLHGLALERQLLQLRAPLPLGPVADPVRARRHGLSLRAFRPGSDEAEWLAINNRAFAGHPEQGGWDQATLQARMGEPWFDPAGLVVLEIEGRPVGSCWTKVHRHHRPPQGEIYVIAVDPSHQGQGLGSVLAVAGLDHLAGAGLADGMLYVEGDNNAALALYRRLGFTTFRTDRAYGIDLAPG